MLTAPGRDACAADLEEYFALLRIMGRPLSEVDPTTPGGVCSTEGCVRKECTLWYGKVGSKICRNCYDKAKTARSRESGGSSSSGSKRPREDDLPSPETILLGADATIAEIHSIVDERFAAAPSPPCPLDDASRAVCARRQFNDSKLERWERRNADAERVLEHEFLVHATVHENDKDKEGEKVLVWLTPADIFRVRGMEADFHQMFNDMAQEREERRVAALQPFTET